MKPDIVDHCPGMSFIGSQWRHDDVIMKEKFVYFVFFNVRKRFLVEQKPAPDLPTCKNFISCFLYFRKRGCKLTGK